MKKLTILCLFISLCNAQENLRQDLENFLASIPISVLKAASAQTTLPEQSSFPFAQHETTLERPSSTSSSCSATTPVAMSFAPKEKEETEVLRKNRWYPHGMRFKCYEKECTTKTTFSEGSIYSHLKLHPNPAPIDPKDICCDSLKRNSKMSLTLLMRHWKIGRCNYKHKDALIKKWNRKTKYNLIEDLESLSHKAD